ncbi:response regulator [Desulfosarcina ovata]|uniref:Response regulatory domain-containing protein n=2 Tax=Desulfosarcina ovata TaxID=83564 RepID=A0A5K8AJW3_9BACT|nr:response regulator [Desulfosarcina ovata]BBO86067.1 hypothetical protein DSCO28_66330 [Desulfosarcina ovata subsp. sediminis]BBO93003.1 hypothetical protein DSCOOX_61830 [Desulfosarcina ovata subsp. ovata]
MYPQGLTVPLALPSVMLPAPFETAYWAVPECRLADNDHLLQTDSDDCRILIVDDDPAVLARVAKMAHRLGFHSTMAFDAVDALYYLTRQSYRVVIANDEMRSIDGYQLALRIKRKYSGTAVIIMTQCHTGAISEPVAPGDIIDGWLLRPFDLKTMRKQIDRVGRQRVIP